MFWDNCEKIMNGEAGTAPIPAPRDGADGVGGAAPGSGCRETGSTARSGVFTAASGGGVRWFCDVHRTRKNKEGVRITYTVDGKSFGHADSFEDLPARAGDKVFVDSIPVQHTDAVLELLRLGVEVYYLRRLTLIARKREELRLPKNERNDLKALMSIEEKWFRRVSEDFLVVRRMVLAYRTLMRTHKQLLSRYSALSNGERSVLRPVIKAVEEQMDELARMIYVEASKRYPAYNRLVEELRIEGMAGLEALAELITYIDFAKSSLRGLKELLGLYKPIRSKKRKYWRLYDGRLHQAVTRLAMAYYRTTPNGRQCWQLIRDIKKLQTIQTPGCPR